MTLVKEKGLCMSELVAFEKISKGINEYTDKTVVYPKFKPILPTFVEEDEDEFSLDDEELQVPEIFEYFEEFSESGKIINLDHVLLENLYLDSKYPKAVESFNEQSFFELQNANLDTDANAKEANLPAWCEHPLGVSLQNGDLSVVDIKSQDQKMSQLSDFIYSFENPVTESASINEHNEKDKLLAIVKTENAFNEMNKNEMTVAMQKASSNDKAFNDDLLGYEDLDFDENLEKCLEPKLCDLDVNHVIESQQIQFCNEFCCKKENECTIQKNSVASPDSIKPTRIMSFENKVRAIYSTDNDNKDSCTLAEKNPLNALEDFITIESISVSNTGEGIEKELLKPLVHRNSEEPEDKIINDKNIQIPRKDHPSLENSAPKQSSVQETALPAVNEQNLKSREISSFQHEINDLSVVASCSFQDGRNKRKMFTSSFQVGPNVTDLKFDVTVESCVEEEDLQNELSPSDESEQNIIRNRKNLPVCYLRGAIHSRRNQILSQVSFYDVFQSVMAYMDLLFFIFFGICLAVYSNWSENYM